ncbi:hydrogen gas-evolving membrane-bound hydrogenase subunit E [Candidatus Margulisiibacteriota bacterium]
MLELYLLLGFILIGAIVAVEIRSLLSSVVALGVVGFAVCVVFFLLRAPDVAITQLIVEIVVIVILIRATGIKKDMVESFGGVREIFSALITFAFILVFGLLFLWALRELPPFGSPLLTVSKTYLANGLKQTGASNLVTAVLLDYRAYDTLGEATVLFTAIAGAIAVLRSKGRKKADERDDDNS